MLTRLVSTASIVCLLAGAAHGQVTYRTVAVSGHLAPGLGGAMFASATFPIVGAPSINTHGQTAFAAQINVNPDGCLWSEGSGTLTLIAREGEAAPDTGGALFKDFYLRAAPINDDGVIAFTHGLEGHGVTTANNAGIWSNNTGALALIVRKGDVAPGAGGSLFSDLGGVLLNNSGDIAFYALVTGPGNGSLWTNAAGTLTIIARDSHAAPGLPGLTFSAISDVPAFTDAGDLAFATRLEGPGVNGITETSIWVSTGGEAPTLAVRGGDPAPGLAGITYYKLAQPDMNSAGNLAFQSELDGTGVTSANDTALWTGLPGAIQLIAREGDTAPGTGGAAFGHISASPRIADDGAVVFTTPLTGAGVTTHNNAAVWRWSNGTLSLVARKGDQAPGAADATFSTFQQPILNASGQVAFTATLTGPGVTFMNDSGLWATNEDHELILVAREGNMFDVSVDPMIIDLREIAAIHLRTGSAGRGRAFSDTGQLAFALDFRPSGNGAFVATIPPPTHHQCYPDCDTSTGQGVLDIFDFLCFGSLFAAGDPYACDCDTTTGSGVCDIFDFLCFGSAFSAGCN